MIRIVLVENVGSLFERQITDNKVNNPINQSQCLSSRATSRLRGDSFQDGFQQELVIFNM